MRSRKSLALFFILSCLFTNFIQAQDKTPLTVVVTDPSGTPVAHATVRLMPAPAPPPSITETDMKGKWRYDVLPGGYALMVSCAGFKTSASHINVQLATTGQNVTVSLQIAAGGSTEVRSPDSLLLMSAATGQNLSLTLSDVKALPHISVTVHDPHANASYSGVRLADLLAKLSAPFGNELRGKTLAMYVVATGSDGYKAVFSLAEIDPSFHPGEIVVADTMNGAPLDAKTGPLRLVATEDKRPARSVRNLVSIELKAVE